MKKKILVFTLFFMLIIPSFPLVSLPEEAEGVLDSFSPSSSKVNSGGVGSGSEEVIDSFDVHPANRWTEEIDTGFTASVNDGLLNLTDMGDGTDDNYVLGRELRDLDGKIEVRFKYNFNMSSPNWQDGFQIRLADAASYGTQISLMVEMGQNNAYSTTKLRYYDVDGAFHDKGLSTDERLYDNLWYVLEFDYDVLKSQCTVECEFDNGTKVFDYDWQDISTSYRPYIFKSSVLRIGLNARSYNDTMHSEFLFDYVKAPFKEREWTQYSSTADDDWLDYSPSVARCKGVVTDDIAYRLTVPYLDFFSGDWNMNWDNASAIDNGDNFGLEVRLYGVDADDGDLHYIIGFEANTGRFGASLWNNLVYLQNGTHNTYFSTSGYTTGAALPNCGGSFSFSMHDNRDEISLLIRSYSDISDDSNFVDLVETELVSDWVTVNSEEFVIELEYDPAITADEESIIVMISNLDLIERNIFDDVGEFIGGVIGGAQDVVSGGADIFTILFRWLGNLLSTAFTAVGEALGVIFLAVGAVIVAALSPIATSLSTLASDIWSGIGNALDFLTTAIGLVTTAVEAIASDVATAVWSGIGSAMDFITTAISGIAAAIWVAVLAVASDLADLVVDIIDFLIGLAGDIVSAIWDFITTAIFFLWDALGLPDLLAVVDLFLVAFVELVNAIPAFIVQVIPRILAIWGLFAVLGIFIFLILPALASESVGEFFEKFIHYFFTDITAGASLLGFSIPVPAGFLWLVTVIYYVLGSTIYGGFFT